MKMPYRNLVGTLIIGLLFAVLCEKASAIPAFARKYKAGCTTCHVAIPARNAFGEAFRRNGYIMPKQDRVQVKQEPLELGAEPWKELFPNTIWPSLLPAEFPLAAYVHQRITADFSGSNSKSLFDMPHELELLIGGTLDRTFSFFGEYELFDDGESDPELIRLFLQVNDLLGPANFLNLRFGKIEPGITDGMVSNQGIMLEKPQVLSYRATGGWRPMDATAGMEINGIVKHRFWYSLGVVNSQGTMGNYNAGSKDFYWRIAAMSGGMAFDGSQERASASGPLVDYWTDNSYTVGFYSYYGRDERERIQWLYLSPSDSSLQTTAVENDFVRYGVDLHINRGRFDFYTGAIAGTDENPDALRSASESQREIKNSAWFAESRLLIFPWCLCGLRLGGSRSSRESRVLASSVEASANLTLLARQNVRVTMEGLILADGKNAGSFDGAASVDDEPELKWIKLNVLLAF